MRQFELFDIDGLHSDYETIDSIISIDKGNEDNHLSKYDKGNEDDHLSKY